MWETIIPAAASVVSTIINGVSANRNIQQTNEAQQRENELAFRRNQQAIREQNQYNSASAQMARLQAAGLNPNLMYDNGQQAAAGIQDSVAQYEPAELNPSFSPVGQLGSQAVDAMIGLKDMVNQTKMTEAKLLTESSTQAVNWSEVKVNENTAKRIIELLGYEKESFKWSAEKLRQEGITQETVRENLKMSTNELAQRILKSQSDIAVNEESIKKMEAEIGKLTAEQREILTLLSYKADFMKASTANAYAACAQAFSAVNYYGKLGSLAEKQEEYIPKKYKQEYWRMGTDAFVGVLGIASKFFFKGMPMSNIFSNNPWQQMQNMSGDAYGTFLSGD